MKNKIYKTTLFFIAILVFSFLSSQVIGQDTELLKAIENLKSQGYGITSIEKLAIDSTMEKPFSEKYCINFEQPIDHNNPNIGKFKQRVIIGFAGFERPSEVVTEGYGAKYAFNPKYRDEPSRLFNTNMVFVEHRYFIGSVPFRQEDTTITDEQLNWEYMNAEQAAGDLHNIVSAFKKIFPGKWIASGISKGGQTTMFYRAFYPNDVDISIPYVGPLCKGVEDGRHEPFIASFAGTPQEREIIKNYQIELLKRRKTIEPILEEYNKKNNLKYKIPLSEIYDYCVLEFPFALWQWGTNISIIPDLKKATDEELFNTLLKVSGPDYFSEEKDSSPFFVQAAKELGYYGYDTKPFKDLLSIKSSKNYLHHIFLPQSQEKNIKFDKYLYKKTAKFLKRTKEAKMLFIYGEYDPWSAVMPVAPVKNEKLKKRGKGRENMVLFIDPKGSHRARISTLPDADKEKAISIINKWLEE